MHDLATNDIYWDRVVDVVSIGHREVCIVADSGTDPVVTEGVVVRYPAG